MSYDPTLCLQVPGRLVSNPTGFVPITSPGSAPSIAVRSPGVMQNDHFVAVSFVYPSGETDFGSSQIGVHMAASTNLALSAIPQPSAGATSIKVYCTLENQPSVSGSPTRNQFYLVATLAVGATTTTIDLTDVQIQAGGNPPGTTISTSTGAFPYGGTALGIKSRAAFVREEVVAFRNSEGQGRDKVKAYRGRVAGSFVFVLIQYDTTVLNKLYAHTTTSGGGFSGANTLRLPSLATNGLTVGAITADSPLLFAADDPAHPSILIHAPLWCIEAKQRLDTTLNKPLEFGVVVYAGIDANGHDVSIDLLENLSLT